MIKMISSTEISEKFQIDHFGSAISINKPSSLKNPKKNSIVFLKKYVKNDIKNISEKDSIFFILPDNSSKKELISMGVTFALSEDPKKTFFSAIETFLSVKNNASAFISPSSSISSNTKIGKNVFIDSGTIIDGDCIIEDNVHISKNCLIIGPCKIGKNTYLSSNVLLGEESLSIRYNNRIPSQNIQLGGISIGKNCRIGMKSSISRGTIDDTIIQNNVMIGEYVHIGHNATVKDNCILTLKSSICGSVTLNEDCWLGPHSVILSQVKVSKNIKLAANSVLYSNVRREGTYLGNPAKLFSKK